MSSFQITSRRPLTNRHLQGPSNPSPAKPHPRTVSGSKRPRSPDLGDAPPNFTTKRVRATLQDTPTPVPPRDLQKERKHAEREQKATEFRQKYTRAFPTWIFYLDSENIGHNSEQTFRSKILHMGAKIEHFFSSTVTHLITDLPVPTNLNPDKENSQNIKVAGNRNIHSLKSPIKLVGRNGDDAATRSVANKAVEYGMKIWTTTKLDSVLSRCIDTPTAKSLATTRFTGTSAAPQRSLSRLLQTEKIHGTTERDPTQKRHDYHYFARGAYFILLEDLRQELATIAAHEYTICKDKSAKKPWPVLYCHPLSRNPFLPFDEKEKKRWERAQQAEKTEEEERHRRKRELEAVKRKAVTRVKPQDLRRALSLNNISRRLSHPIGGQHDGPRNIDLDADQDDLESARASGYIAASGNSVSITSTTGTTSTSGSLLRNFSLLPATKRQINQQVVTSRKHPVKERPEGVDHPGTMGPPKVPTQHVLKKSKSTNTIKLAKREEGVKPGYCESCREKFNDFNAHTVSKKHRKFASNPTNFAALDAVLSRVQRQSRQEVEVEEALRTFRLFNTCKRNRHLRADDTRHIQRLSSPSSPR
ncbi:hypothetical protein GALMADRAFT_280094 [Galerina marginata CBS 339.88]|uniref:DBF4-type domain-containing protein n=1 Tax=Galerina marginata (strain CBS 339.88) TaxID=685588 RepID=A0A067SWV9_GALM3|nr:hypothetical protein GALMADRAFT_280094 [Galerina marginata CBS 339.88]